MSAKSEIPSEIPQTTEALRGEWDICFFLVICFLHLNDHQKNTTVSLAPQGFCTRPYCDVIKYSAKTQKFKDLWYLLSQKVKKKLCDLWKFCAKMFWKYFLHTRLIKPTVSLPDILSLSLCILQ